MNLHEYAEADVNEDITCVGILVVNDDLACRNYVAEVLRLCKYQVLHTGSVYDALHAIWENRNRLNLVITNAHKLKSEGLAIIQNLKEKLDLDVGLLDIDGRFERRGEAFSFSAYALTDSTSRGLKILLKNARRMEEQRDEAGHLNQKKEAAEVCRERSKQISRGHRRKCKSKKPRFNWTAELHERFAEAVDILGGPYKALPSKLLEVMAVPRLTREVIASYLQKYRADIKRRTELAALGVVLTSPSSFKTNWTAIPHNSYSIPTFEHQPLLKRKFCTTNDDPSAVHNLRNMDTSSEFVGFRFEGNKIDYGPTIKTGQVFSTPENQSTSYVHRHPVSDRNHQVGSAGCILQQSCSSRTPAFHQPVPNIHGTETADSNDEPDFLSSYAPKIEEDVHQHTPTLSSDSLMFHPPPPDHQDLSLLSPEAVGNDFAEQSPAAFVDGILQQHCSTPPPLSQMHQDLDEILCQSGNEDDALMNGIGNAWDKFDFPELDDTFFSQDD